MVLNFWGVNTKSLLLTMFQPGTENNVNWSPCSTLFHCLIWYGDYIPTIFIDYWYCLSHLSTLPPGKLNVNATVQTMNPFRKAQNRRRPDALLCHTLILHCKATVSFCDTSKPAARSLAPPKFVRDSESSDELNRKVFLCNLDH